MKALFFYTTKPLFQRVLLNLSNLRTVSVAIHYFEYVCMTWHCEYQIYFGFRFHHYHQIFLTELVILLLCVLPFGQRQGTPLRYDLFLLRL